MILLKYGRLREISMYSDDFWLLSNTVLSHMNKWQTTATKLALNLDKTNVIQIIPGSELLES